jgi:phytanoyl-CoA hydroxylase
MVSQMDTPTRHRWNTDFTWQGSRGPYAEAFDTVGAVVVPGLFTADEIAAVRTIIDELEAQSEAFLRSLDGERFSIAEAGAITFTTHLVAKSPELAAFSKHPNLVQLCLDLIGPDVNLYWDQAVYKKPEKPRRFPWHQDNGYAFVQPQQYLTCWIPLTDATRENGCPQVATGLHRLGTLRHEYVEPLGFECFSEPPAEVLVAEAPVGSAVVFSSLTPHLTGPNTTDAVRKAYILQYAPMGARKRVDDDTWETCDAPERQYAVTRGGEAV